MKSIKQIKDLKNIFSASLIPIDPYNMITQCLELRNNILSINTEGYSNNFNLENFEKIIVIGAGKATSKMALALEKVLGKKITKGTIAVKPGHTDNLKFIEMIEAGHPLPNSGSIKAAKKIVELTKESGEKTLFINIISGGGSALLTLPFQSDDKNINSLTLKDMIDTTKLLLSCGATIQEINCIRKHISHIKGGRLANLMNPSVSINLILSDVVGDRLDSIASGLTTPDETTYMEANEIIKKYNLTNKLPVNISTVLKAGLKGNVKETPKKNEKIFKNVHNILIGTNYKALLAAKEKAKKLKYNTVLLSSQITGESKEIAKFYYGLSKDIKKHQTFIKLPACIIAGGETTVTISGKGKGGRNQEMSLSFLSEIANDKENSSGIYFLSGATDGNDGPTDAAGAFASNEIIEEAENIKLNIIEYLKNNDAYNFFNKVGYLLKTGPTNTNVCDIQIIIIV